MGSGQAETDDLTLALIALLENVERLTKPYVDRVEQDTRGSTKTVKVTHPPLFDQLDQAVHSTQTTLGRGGALASERNVIDTSAWMLRDAIRQELHRMWTKIINRAMPETLTDATRIWHLEFRVKVQDGKIPRDSVWAAVRRTSTWVKQIQLKFDPPVTLEVTRPCPQCTRRFVYNEHNERVFAVVIVWQKTFSNSNASCRACGHTWYGESELRQLRYDIDTRDTPGMEG